jgi:phosphoribosylglycinamide formyltransferase-1
MNAAPSRRRVAVLISGRGSNMTSLIAAAKDPAFPAEIALVLSNRPKAPGLATARENGVTTVAIDHNHHLSREDFERAMQEVLEAHGIELVCLAGFMRILTAWFVERWTGRMINIHPALLPLYRGLHTHERALADGVKLHGASVHFVVPGMDEGPIIAQAAVPVLDGDTPDALGARVLAQEHVIYPLALGLLAGGRLTIDGARVRVSGEAAETSALVAPQVAQNPAIA